MKREALLEAKDETHKLRIEAEREFVNDDWNCKSRKIVIYNEKKILIAKKILSTKEKRSLGKKEEALTERQQRIEQMERKAEDFVAVQQTELERISALTREEAKAYSRAKWKKSLLQISPS